MAGKRRQGEVLGGGRSYNVRAGNPASAANAPITGRRSRVRLLIWNSSEPPGASFRRVQRQRLASKQVHRDTVGAEGVNNQHIVGAVWRRSYRQPRIAQHNTRMVPAIREKLEVAGVTRNTFDQRVDFVECPILPRLGIAGESASSQSDHCDMLNGPRRE